MTKSYEKFNLPTPRENPYLYAAIYSRRSSPQENNSLETQEELALDTLTQHNLLLYKKYRDVISAKEPLEKRTGFQQLLKDAAKGLFKTVIVFKRDRLARRFTDYLKIKNYFNKYNIKIIYSDKSEVNVSNNKFLSSFIDNIIFAIAELEPEMIRHRAVTGKMKKLEKGEYSSTKLAIGYERFKDKTEIQKRLNELENIIKVSESKKIDILNSKTCYLPKPAYIDLIKKVFELYLNLNKDQSVNKDIIRKINEIKENIEGNNFESIDYQNIASIIKNPIYCGYYLTKPKIKLDFKDWFVKDKNNNQYKLKDDILQPCKNIFPIIDKNIWVKAATKFRNRLKTHKARNSTYLFKNLLYCGECSTPEKDKKIYLSQNRYYKCYTKGCFFIRKENLQNMLFSELTKNALNSGNLTEYIDSKISKTKYTIKICKRKLKSLQDKCDEKLNEYIEHPEEKIKKEFDSINKEIQNLENEIQEYNNEINKLANLRDKLKKLNKSQLENINLIDYLKVNEEMAQEILISIIDKVVLYKNKSYEIKYK